MKATKGGVLEERHTVIVVREVLLALSFLHKAGVIHRDIKGGCLLPPTSYGGLSSHVVSFEQPRTSSSHRKAVWSFVISGSRRFSRPPIPSAPRW